MSLTRLSTSFTSCTPMGGILLARYATASTGQRDTGHRRARCRPGPAKQRYATHRYASRQTLYPCDLKQADEVDLRTLTCGEPLPGVLAGAAVTSGHGHAGPGREDLRA